MTRPTGLSQLLGSILLLALGLMQLGCLINVGGTKIVDESAARVAVEFESDEGMAAFVEHVKRQYPFEKDQGGGYFGIPFIIGVSERRVLSENAHYNAAIAKIDLNQDGILSDAELNAAHITARRNPPQTVDQVWQ